MSRKQRRLYFVLLGLLALGAASALVLTALQEDIAFFYSPTEIVEKGDTIKDRRIRLGGLVEQGSVKLDGSISSFNVTDGANVVTVSFNGLLPDLFREGQGIVSEGKMVDGKFVASEVLAKHDENYMPAEVVESLKKSGQWQMGGEPIKPPAAEPAK